MPGSSPTPAAPEPADGLHLAIAGATGAVGLEFLEVLAQRDFPIRKLTLLASSRSAGKTLDFRGTPHVVRELTEGSFEGVDVALFSAGGAQSKAFAAAAVGAGAVVVDNSSAFRMTDGVPLVVPEVNPEAIPGAGLGLSRRGGRAGVIANPNCSTIIMLVALHPLHAAAGVRRIVVSTYQAASGAGLSAMQELEQQTREALDDPRGRASTMDVFGKQYAFNLFSHNSPMQPNGYNEEELKMVHETHKIWGQLGAPAPDRTAITATCVRVPVMRAHAESINLTLDRALTADAARALLADAPGVSLIDDREANRFPEPLDAAGRDDVYVGRIRDDLSQPQGRGLDLFVCGDQIRKGAALNAVQIAELLVGAPVGQA